MVLSHNQHIEGIPHQQWHSPILAISFKNGIPQPWWDDSHTSQPAILKDAHPINKLDLFKSKTECNNMGVHTVLQDSFFIGALDLQLPIPEQWKHRKKVKNPYLSLVGKVLCSLEARVALVPALAILGQVFVGGFHFALQILFLHLWGKGEKGNPPGVGKQQCPLWRRMPQCSHPKALPIHLGATVKIMVNQHKFNTQPHFRGQFDNGKKTIVLCNLQIPGSVSPSSSSTSRSHTILVWSMIRVLEGCSMK